MTVLGTFSESIKNKTKIITIRQLGCQRSIGGSAGVVEGHSFDLGKINNRPLHQKLIWHFRIRATPD
jgi:hypothetical protein